MAVDLVQKCVNRGLRRAAIQTAVRVKTAVQLESETRHMEKREAAFRRLVVAEQKTKNSREGRSKQKRSKQKSKEETSKKTFASPFLRLKILNEFCGLRPTHSVGMQH